MGITSMNSECEDQVIPKSESHFSSLTQNSDNDETISFVESSTECCVGIVDVVSSTKVTASLPHTKVGKFYGIFLNTMTQIVKRFGGIVVKNGGDSLLYYFQGSPSDAKSVFVRCLECSLAMIEARHEINTKLYEEKIPPLAYRVSADYGKVTLARSSNLSYHDIFGSPVNFCSKINCRAMPNTVVIGGDLYRAAKTISGYKFNEVTGYCVGFKYQYPVYNVTRNLQCYRSIVGVAIEKSLLEIGTPVLDTAASHLFNRYHCLLTECYDNPEYLTRILKELFGNAHTSILHTIRENLGEYVHQKPIMEFLERLDR
jgi:class 3 adenylate cyclase